MLAGARSYFPVEGGAAARRRVLHNDREVEGGFNRSSQHLLKEVDDAEDRETAVESLNTVTLAVSGAPAGLASSGAAAILGGYCRRVDE